MSTALAGVRGGGPMTGTAPLLRASFRHDGRMFAPWILIATALSASSMIYPYIFNTEQERQAFAAAIGANPAIGLIFGPAFDKMVDMNNRVRAEVDKAMSRLEPAAAPD